MVLCLSRCCLDDEGYNPRESERRETNNLTSIESDHGRRGKNDEDRETEERERLHVA